MVSNMAISMALNIFCRQGSLFDILIFLWTLYNLNDVVFAGHTLEAISSRDRMICLCSNCIVWGILVVGCLNNVVMALD